MKECVWVLVSVCSHTYIYTYIYEDEMQLKGCGWSCRVIAWEKERANKLFFKRRRTRKTTAIYKDKEQLAYLKAMPTCFVDDWAFVCCFIVVVFVIAVVDCAQWIQAHLAREWND